MTEAASASARKSHPEGSVTGLGIHRSIEEEIPWKCRRLVIGTGTGALPVMEEVNSEAHRRKIKLQILPTAEAIKILEKDPERTNAILHLSC